MPEDPSEKSAADLPPQPVLSPVAPAATATTTAASGLPITGSTLPPGYKGPTEAPARPSGITKPKEVKVKLKKEAMGVWEPSGYQAPGATFITTEERAKELGGCVEILGDAEEGDLAHTAGDPENTAKSKPAGVESQPGGQTPV